MANAFRLIAENKETRAAVLDLSDCGLTEIPAGIQQMVWLESLNLSSNERLTDLARLPALSSLRTLILVNTKVRSLAPLASLSALQRLDVSDTQVRYLDPLVGLTALQSLDISYTKVSDLAPLAGLTALQSLVVYNTQVRDLAPLAGLPALQRLIAYSTQISDLAPLARLFALETLDLRRTPVSDVAPLAALLALQVLIVNNTQVGDLSPLLALIRRGVPVEWSSPALGGSGIYVEDCPLTNPPPEIVKQGNEAILNYFAERKVAGVDHPYEAKMLILGEGGAGKTSLLRRLYEPGQPLPAESDTTRGIAIYRHEFKLKNGRTFCLNVWDFGGQEIYHATHQFFLTRRSLYILVDDTRKDCKSVSDEGFKYWLELIDVFGGHSPTLIFQNEKDGRSKAIDFDGIQRRYDNVKKLYAGDLAKDGAADKVRKGIEDFASNLPHIGDEVPARWILVRAEIELLAAKEPHIPVEKYSRFTVGISSLKKLGRSCSVGICTT